MEDKKLMRTIERNPEKGIAIALELYGDAVKTICRDILSRGTAEDVEEAIAETFIRLWRYGRNFRPGKETSLKSYIYGIARNAARDKCKTLSKGETADGYLEETIPDLDEGAEELVLRREEESAVRQAVAEMDEPDRTIFTMRFFQEQKIKDIASMLGIPTKQVENRLFRSKAVLRKKLEERGMGDE